LLASPELVPEWRIKVERLLRRAQGPVGGWNDYRPLVVSKRELLSSEVVSLDLQDPSGEPLPAFDAGQFLTLRLDLSDQDKPLLRTYTLVGHSEDDRGYHLAVKREMPPVGKPSLPAGVGSGYLHDQILQGSTIMALSPRGHFVVEPGSRPIVLLSAGIGVTPMLAMFEHLATCPLKRQVLFVHCARSSEAHIFGERVRKLVSESDVLRSHVLYSQPGPNDAVGRDFDATGRLTAETLDGLLPSFNADYYLCGPESFMRDMVQGLMARGVPKDQIRYEFFGSGTSLFEDEVDIDSLPDAHDADGRPIIVTFARSGLSVPWKEGVFSMLSLAELSGLRPDASCRTGLCANCICRIDGGDIEYVIAPLEMPRRGEVMICCARPTTSVMLDL
jgi:ferredoxin-NADP reductase